MSDLRHLSGRRRDENLKKMRPLGTWERERLDREQGRNTKKTTPPPVSPAAVNHKITNTRKEGKMATDKGIGICTLCDQEKTMRQVKGKKYCATCLSITSLVANHRELLVKAMQVAGFALGAPGDMAGPLAQTEEVERLQGEQKRLFSVIEGLEEEKVRLRQQLADDNLALTGELEGLQDVLASVDSERAALTAEKDRLTEEVRWLYERLATTEKKGDWLDHQVDNFKGMLAKIEESHGEQRLELEILRHQLRENGTGSDPVPDVFGLADPAAAFRATASLRKAWTVPDPESPGILTETQEAISDACDSLRSMLIDKNRAYGNSALAPMRVFSRASAQEQILVRIDDKLSRLARGSEFPGDDTIMDLAGYMVLLMVQRTQGQDVQEVAA